jgi:RNA polymerase sigma factor (sigma-70 family)
VSTNSPTSQGVSRALIARARAGDAYARDAIVRELMPMAQRVASRFAGSQHPAEDLAQVAGIGLLKALERFDDTRDAAFSTYAHSLMTGEVRRHIRDSRMVRIPRSIYEQVPNFQRTLSRLRFQLGREPTRAEIAADLGITVEDVIEVADAALHAQHVSLDAAAENSGGELPLAARDDGYARAEAGADLAPMLSVLTERERMIIDYRFQDGLSQLEIADGMGISQTQVSRLIRQALDKLSKRAGIAA